MRNWWQKTFAGKASEIKARGGAVMLGLIIFSTPAACRAQPKVFIQTEEGHAVSFQVEIAATPEKRELGLQYRRELPATRGMLFIFPVERDNSFWMKNTPIPLDMIFINRGLKIVGIVENAVPFSLEGRSVGAPSRYVLEIRGGLSRRHGFKVGNSVRFENIAPEAVQE